MGCFGWRLAIRKPEAALLRMRGSLLPFSSLVASDWRPRCNILNNSTCSHNKELERLLIDNSEIGNGEGCISGRCKQGRHDALAAMKMRVHVQVHSAQSR